MKPVQLYVGTALLIAATTASGVIQGRLSGRWGPPQKILTAATKLAEFPPSSIGSWELEEQLEFSDRVINMLNCAGYISRVYVNRQTGEVVNLAVVLGPHGQTSSHTPDICYAKREYEPEKRQQRELPLAAGRNDSFWSINLHSKELDGRLVRVYYAWGTGSGWLAPEEPRLTFVGQPFLYKVQIASEIPLGPTGDTESDACQSFLKEFLPELQPFLVETE